MSKFELKLPKMGESVAEATLTAWLKDVGETIEFDEAVVEIATDKVDSEVPSEKKGVLIEKCFQVDDVIEVGQTIAIIETDEEETDDDSKIESHNEPESPASDATTLKMQDLFSGSDVEDDQVSVGYDNPLTQPRELFGADPLIVEATEPQPGDPEIDGGEMVLDEPPPSRSNDEAGRPNREDAAPKKYGCSKCRWQRKGCARCRHWAGANKRGYALDSMGIPYRPNAQ